jgi:hypothetical protein
LQETAPRKLQPESQYGGTSLASEYSSYIKTIKIALLTAAAYNRRRSSASKLVDCTPSHSNVET